MVPNLVSSTIGNRPVSDQEIGTMREASAMPTGQRICERSFPGRYRPGCYRIDVIGLKRHPQRVKEDQFPRLPTLV